MRQMTDCWSVNKPASKAIIVQQIFHCALLFVGCIRLSIAASPDLAVFVVADHDLQSWKTESQKILHLISIIKFIPAHIELGV